MTQKNTMFRLFSLLLITVMMLGGCAMNAPSTTPLPEGRSDYVLGVGDTINIVVYGHTDLSGDFTVEQNGMISFPLIQDVAAAGFTSKELEQTITQKLGPDYLIDPKVSVDVAAFRNVYILGEVTAPGKYEYVPNMTLLQAVAIAGGYTYRAQENSAEVTRHVKGGLSTFTVNTRTMIKPGDTIVVKRRWF